MKKLYRNVVWLLLAVFVFTVGSGFSVRKAAALPAVGETLSGFRAERVERLSVPGGWATYLTHETTGAEVVYIEDTGASPAFSLSVRTAGAVRRLAAAADTPEELLRGAETLLDALFSGAEETTVPILDGSAAYRAFLGVLLPGSDAAGSGEPEQPMFPANTLAVVCAGADTGGKMLALLNKAFSSVPAGDALAPDAGYRRMEKAASETVSVPAAEADGAGVYFGIVCPRSGEWTRPRLAALAAAMNRGGSVLEKRVQELLPGAAVTCGTASAGPDAALWFFAPGLGEKDAEPFRSAVLAALRSVAENGLSAQTVETLAAAQRLEELTFPEREDLGEALCAGFAAAWAHGGASEYPAQLAEAWNADALFQDGSCAEVVREELLTGDLTALVTVVPEPPTEPEPPAEPEPSPEPEKAETTEELPQ